MRNEQSLPSRDDRVHWVALGGDPARVRAAREVTTRLLADWHPEARYDAQLLVSAMVADAVRHGDPGAALRLAQPLPNVFRVEVDTGGETPLALCLGDVSDDPDASVRLIGAASIDRGSLVVPGHDYLVVWAELVNAPAQGWTSPLP